jgi:hypothetical protein
VEVGISGVEKPAFVESYSDSTETSGVTGKRDEQDISIEFIDGLGSGDPHPGGSGLVVNSPLGTVIPLERLVPFVLHPGRGVMGGLELGGMDVDSSPGKVGERSGVVQIHVSQNDVLKIVRRNAAGF